MNDVLLDGALEVGNLSVTFAGQRALDDVSLRIARGSVTALLGMNGSGKSTLIKVLAGIYTPDADATLTVGGQQVTLPLTPSEAHSRGLRFLHQDVGLVQDLTVADNFAFTDGFATNFAAAIDRRRQHERVASALAHFNLPVSPGALVKGLTPTQQTMVGVARAFQSDVGDDGAALKRNILILDEPTASLPAAEVEALLAMVEQIRAGGGTIIYVSHRLEEVRRLADHLIILRDGRKVGDEPIGELSVDDIVTRVVGHEVIRQTALPAQTSGRELLRVRDLSGPRLDRVSLSVAAGEVVGITGLVGCGRSELIRMIAGVQAPASGSMFVQERPHAPSSPADAIGSGVTCVPQERRRDGVVLSMSVRENLTLGNLNVITRAGYLSPSRERAVVRRLRDEYQIKSPGLEKPVSLLSGGNQQKVVVARAASHDSSVLLLDEPTQGVDAHAKEEISNIIRGLAQRGNAVLIASTDFEGFVGLCHRVIILDRGKVFETLSGAEISEDRIADLCARSGLSRNPKDALIDTEAP